MSRILCLCGKSSSGKDTIYKRLLQDEALKLKTIIPYTTRPIRAGEQDGVEYHFTDEAGYRRWRDGGKILEERSYDTFHGRWRYFTADDGQLQDDGDYLMIGTPEACFALQEHFGRERVLPLLIELDDGVRLERALRRERRQKNPKYEEMCRRYLADSEDFAPEKIARVGIAGRFVNDDLERCLRELKAYIAEGRSENGYQGQSADAGGECGAGAADGSCRRRRL